MSSGWNRAKFKKKPELKFTHHKAEFTKEWIESIPKIINSNGCWIPANIVPSSSGYCKIMINYEIFWIHRMAMCLYYNIDYNNKKIETRHGINCDKRCFWYEHLKPGSASENAKDIFLHKKLEGGKK